MVLKYTVDTISEIVSTVKLEKKKRWTKLFSSGHRKSLYCSAIWPDFHQKSKTSTLPQFCYLIL